LLTSHHCSYSMWPLLYTLQRKPRSLRTTRKVDGDAVAGSGATRIHSKFALHPHQLHPLCQPTTLLLGPPGARLSLADISRDMAHAQAIALPRVVAKKSWKSETGGKIFFTPVTTHELPQHMHRRMHTARAISLMHTNCTAETTSAPPKSLLRGLRDKVAAKAKAKLPSVRTLGVAKTKNREINKVRKGPFDHIHLC
jgi:hypothetical protein